MELEDPAGEPEEPSSRAKWSEATGQAILLTGIAWSLFTLGQARWYMPAFNVHPYDVRFFAVTFLTGAVPTLLVLVVAFVASWLIGRLRGRADPWRAWRDAVVAALVFTVLANVGMWLGEGLIRP
ncbi:MAG TPA: hypothetical protein VEA60_06535 [Allosphingosinicella sp.]|nr:hypothetical protein [Allosphingosinicella sp.]